MTIKYETNASILITEKPLCGSESVAVVYRVGSRYIELRQGRNSSVRLDKKQLKELQQLSDKICEDLEQ